MDRIYFQWHITNICNFRCRHCYQDIFDDREDLDWQGLKRTATSIIQTAHRQNKKLIISITGGEPLLKKEFFILLDYLQSEPEIEKLIIITNGSLLNSDVLERLKRYNKINEIKLSLEGASPSTNDRIRGRGSFVKVLEKIHLIKRETEFSCTVMFTVFKSNIEELPLLYQLAKKELVSGIVIERFLPLGRGKTMESELLDYSDWYRLNKIILDLDNFPFSLEDLLPYRAFWIKFLSKKTELLGASCNVGEDAFCIMPNADIQPCRRFTLKLGNLLKDSLEEIMESRLMEEIISVPRQGACQNCKIYDCRGCPALSYILKRNWQAEDLQCWYKRR
ncbi:MAG: radical SAM protein [Candidatus Omnitrophica bacterium]|nr:radical SAM protein [Candidatus Omnitrophota bacterium]